MRTKGSVMFVDDEEGVRVSWDRFLSQRGFDVTTAVDGSAAIDELRKHPVDVVVSDWRMPAMDGLELLRRVHEEDPEPRFILLTGYGDDEVERRARELGAFEYLNKPISPETLAAVITAAMYVEPDDTGDRTAEAEPQAAAEAAVPDAGPEVREAAEPPEADVARLEETEADRPGPALRTAQAVGGVILAPLLGLAFVIMLPILGFVALFWVLAEAAMGRPSAREG